MPADGQHKAGRLNLVVNLLGASPRGLTTRELAGQLGVEQRTVQRYLEDLQAAPHRIPLRSVGTRWILDPDYKPLLSALRLTLPEATALVLAARLLQRASDEVNPHVTSALTKLDAVLPPPMREHLRQLIAIVPEAENRQFVNTYEVLVTSWAGRRTARLRYWPAESKETADVFDTDYDVYFLDANAYTLAMYAIGYAHARRDIRTFKLERILSAELTDREFEVDPAFDPVQFLTSAWGIMGGQDVQTVRLRVAPEAVRFFHESHYHHSQEMQEQPDGSCVVTFRVAGPIELIRYFQSFGPRIEVLEPAGLREQIALEAAETARVYGPHDGPLTSRGRQQ